MSSQIYGSGRGAHAHPDGDDDDDFVPVKDGAAATITVVRRDGRWWCVTCGRTLAECLLRAERGRCREAPRR